MQAYKVKEIDYMGFPNTDTQYFDSLEKALGCFNNKIDKYRKNPDLVGKNDLDNCEPIIISDYDYCFKKAIKIANIMLWIECNYEDGSECDYYPQTILIEEIEIQ